MTKLVKFVVMSLTVACTIHFSAQAAENTKEVQAGNPGMSQNQNFDDATLAKFTVAMNAVSEVADKYQSTLSGEESPEKMKEIQQAAQTEMVSEIEKTGLEVDTYTTIAQLVQTNEQLRERVLNIAKKQNSQS
ncbi:DUF4168 domain-containing protein [Aestuariibacter sp. A3R04]|uniref:DUF4168 domain-containing protein n=1 Tax=Aestuariibacter sp. A3R04 TaxID=2841571 RepID=UPI001C08DC2A|nr:DUF4168 domain-containing protein [Aestuariibacter sp. A3R04]MBU3020764.1 DUF4168 domain-containing protein [Aestuariibacter sp. A3R04]